MQHVSRELAARMVKAGWLKETYWVHYSWDGEEWEIEAREDLEVGTMHSPPYWLPAPTLCEVVEEVSYDDFLRYWKENLKPDSQYDSALSVAMFENAVAFARWHDATMRSADACAEVWLKLHEKEGKE